MDAKSQIPAGRPPAGFTLVELLICLALLSVLVAWSTPGLSRIGEEERAAATLDELRAGLELARIESIRRGNIVMLCRANSAFDDCADYRATGAESWAQGWLLFEDQDNDKRFDPADGETLLRVGNALPRGYRLKWRMGDYIAFAPTGALASRSGSFCLDRAGGTAQERVELHIPYTGRVRLSRDQCGFEL